MPAPQEKYCIKTITDFSAAPHSDEFIPAYEIIQPSHRAAPVVFNSPHSGRAYPQSFLKASRLNQHEIRQSEDAYVDLLLKDAENLGAPILKANFPRAYLDVNREAYELDPKMFNGSLPKHINSRSIRVAGGLGTIARIVSERKEIYRHRIPAEEGLSRIETIYKPYHKALRNLLKQSQDQFGTAILLDCHSMPSVSANKKQDPKADFVIGDRFGSSCSAHLSSCAVGILQSMGYNVAINRPYAGGYITEFYGRPERGIHALQVEINRALYMDEKTLKPHAGFKNLQADLHNFLASIISIISHEFTETALAAE